MKKLLLATSALAFAGSAFASDVSGYVTQGFSNMKMNNDKGEAETTRGLWTESEVYVSGSKTASNGLTFGGTYTIGLWGGSKSALSADVASNSVNIEEGPAYTKVRGFISSSFGKVTMGEHNSASRSHGASFASVGNGPAGDGYANTEFKETRMKAVDAITYSSPSFNGISGAYTMSPAKDSPSSGGFNYSNTMSGIGLAFAFGMYKPAKDEDAGINEPKFNNAWNLKVSKGAFAGSFGMGTKSKDNIETENKDKDDSNQESMRFGVAYSAGKVGVGFSYKQVKQGDLEAAKYMTMSAKYTIATGLSAYVQQTTKDQKAGGIVDKDIKDSTWLVGTEISF